MAFRLFSVCATIFACWPYIACAYKSLTWKPVVLRIALHISS
jgi:hypothetical protein